MPDLVLSPSARKKIYRLDCGLCNAPAIPPYKKWSKAWNICTCFSDQIGLQIGHDRYINILKQGSGAWIQRKQDQI